MVSAEPASTGPRFDLLVIGDQVVIGRQVVAAGIAIRGERMAALLDLEQARQPGLAARTIDATGKVVLPGAIDAHVHHRTRNDSADSWESVTRAAAHGGVTTIIPYITGPVGTPLGENLEYQRQEGERAALVDFAMHCRLNGPSDEVFEQLPDAFALGVPSFKLFMAYRKRGIMWEGHPLMRALDAIGRRGGIWNCHAEEGDLIDYLEDQYIARGEYRPSPTCPVVPIWPRSRRPSAPFSSVASSTAACTWSTPACPTCWLWRPRRNGPGSRLPWKPARSI